MPRGGAREGSGPKKKFINPKRNMITLDDHEEQELLELDIGTTFSEKGRKLILVSLKLKKENPELFNLLIDSF